VLDLIAEDVAVLLELWQPWFNSHILSRRCTK
jgi:hypothetical protein